MKKRQTLTSLIWAIMRFSGLQIVFMAILSSAVIASPADTYGQNVLEEIVTLNAENQKIKHVLLEIEKSVNIKFTYNPQSIAVDKKVSFDYKNQKLADVLEGIFRPLNIRYELSGDYIILRKDPLEVSSTTTEPTSLYGVAFSVTGKVVDEEGSGLPGVNIVVKGSTIGTTTDSEGKYAISVADGTETL